MITKLESLTLSQFIAIVCGDMHVLFQDGEEINPNDYAIAVRDIVVEYRSIADPGANNAFLHKSETLIKAKLSYMLFIVCDSLNKIGEYERVRDILCSSGMNASKWNEKRIDGTVKAKLAQAEREFKEYEKEQEELAQSQTEIRKYFDAQIASLMAHYKFQIDPDTIKATVYAHLVARYNREIKAQINAVRKK